MIMYAIMCSTIAILARNITAIAMLTMHLATITAKTIAVQTLILEDAADTEDNILEKTKRLTYNSIHNAHTLGIFKFAIL